MLARILTPIKFIPSFHEPTAQLHITSEPKQRVTAAGRWWPSPGLGARGRDAALAEALTVRPYIPCGAGYTAGYTAPGCALGTQPHFSSHMQQPVLDHDVLYFTLRFLAGEEANT